MSDLLEYKMKKILGICQIIIKMFSLLSLIFNPIRCDAPEPWQLGFQDGASPTYEGITELHNSIFFYLVVIFIGVSWVFVSIIMNFSHDKNPIVYKYLNHGTVIELIWTITPAFVLIAIAFPSFKLLYLMDEVISPSMTIKAVGHQWYWSYEYSDFVNEDGESIEFDSYMIPDSDLEDGQLRLLDVDNRIVVPVDTHIRFVVTGADVIHDFAVPALGLKIDCTPGNRNIFIENNNNQFFSFSYDDILKIDRRWITFIKGSTPQRRSISSNRLDNKVKWKETKNIKDASI